MPASDDDLRARLADLGEDAHWEFKQIEFSGDKPKSPTQQLLADELAAFANAEGGILLCGVTDAGALQHLSREQMTALEQRLVEACRSSIKPPIAPTIAHRKLDGRASSRSKSQQETRCTAAPEASTSALGAASAR